MKENLNPYFKGYKISRIQEICDRLPISNNLKDIFNQLNTLNIILAKTLPEHLVKFCRIGAIDQEQNCVILFITDQQAYHILRNFSEHIIQSFYNHGFHFNSILTKIAKPTSLSTAIEQEGKNHLNLNNNKVNKEPTNQKRMEALSKLAIALGKPEIIIDN